MKFFVAIAAALLIVSLIIPASGAVSETDWRILLRCDNGAGGGFGPDLHVGVASTSLDGLDTEDRVALYYTDVGETTRWAVGVLPGDTEYTYGRNIESPAPPWSYPQNRKVWDLSLGALPKATSAPMRLQVRSSTANPAPTVGGLPFTFELVMVDNRGMSGAAPNGTRWSVPIPTGEAGTVCWSMDTAADRNGIVWGNLPILKLSDSTHSAMLAEGYKLEFVQTAVPEPSGILALSAGLLGLIGLGRRRYR